MSLIYNKKVTYLKQENRRFRNKAISIETPVQITWQNRGMTQTHTEAEVRSDDPEEC